VDGSCVIGHTFFVDNQYASPDLCKRVTNRSENVSGKVEPNRGTSHTIFLQKNWQEGNLRSGQWTPFCAWKWKDKKDIYVLSSSHATANITPTRKLEENRSATKRRGQEAWVSSGTLEGMGGVYLQDQVSTLFPIMRDTVMGYQKIFLCLLNTCISVCI
jgi:hypothetical protein